MTFATTTIAVLSRLGNLVAGHLWRCASPPMRASTADLAIVSRALSPRELQRHASEITMAGKSAMAVVARGRCRRAAASPPLLRLRLAPHALGPTAPQARAGLSRIVGTRGARAASFCPMGMPTSGRPHFRRAARRAPLEQCPRQESSRPRRDVLGAGRWGNRRHRCAGDGRAGRRAAASMAGRLRARSSFFRAHRSAAIC
jgi:hypothetical protein